jgi:hypothetical protein
MRVKIISFASKYGVYLLIALISALYWAVEFLWKPSFMDGKIIGIYKLFVVLDKTDLRLAILAIILSICLFSSYFLIDVARRDDRPDLLVIGYELLLCGLVLGFTWLYGVRWSRPLQLDNLRALDKAYYLASYRTDSTSSDYRLYECDSWGIFCRLAYRSDDSQDAVFTEELLQYDQANNKILVLNGHRRVIYEYQIP